MDRVKKKTPSKYPLSYPGVSMFYFFKSSHPNPTGEFMRHYERK